MTLNKRLDSCYTSHHHHIHPPHSLTSQAKIKRERKAAKKLRRKAKEAEKAASPAGSPTKASSATVSNPQAQLRQQMK